jgi:hypothetical protein
MIQNPFVLTLIVFVCVFSSAVAGVIASRFWPQTHLDERSKDIVKLGIGIVGTMTVLVLSLMLNSVKTSFDTTDRDLRQFATNIIVLDRSIKRYGPEAEPARAALRQYTRGAMQELWPAGTDSNIRVETLSSGHLLDKIQDVIDQLQPGTARQSRDLSLILDHFDDLIHSRWVFVNDSTGSVQRPFVVIVIGWLMIIFGSFGLYAPRNGTVVLMLGLSAISLGGAIYLICDLESPFGGIVKISQVPMRNALIHQNQ